MAVSWNDSTVTVGAGSSAVERETIEVAEPRDTAEIGQYDLTIDARQAQDRSFLLGNRGGFVLYLPVARNTIDRTLTSSKWYGASGFGRTYLTGIVVWAESEGGLVALNRANQTGFTMCLDEAVYTFQVGSHELRGRLFVPDEFEAVILTMSGDLPMVVKPEFDMRYYQKFNTDFTQYSAEESDEGLLIRNRVENAGAAGVEMSFFGLVSSSGAAPVEMVPPEQALVPKTYRKDERRGHVIRAASAETEVQSPDNAPIWDQYSTQVYAPARFHLESGASLILAFGDNPEEVRDCSLELHQKLPQLRVEKRSTISRGLDQGRFETGNRDVDLAYAHVYTRFNEALVARDAILHIDPIHEDHYYGIFAGNKYFLDAWKRDENISLDALLVTNDYESTRLILASTWRFQDDRTGRLPHIIRAGEPLVYFSSDGTLWALHRLFEYTRASGDESLLREKLSMVEKFFAASMGFVQRGWLPSGGIITPDYLWETWEDTPFTPRAGFPVEIELLWLTVLTEFLPYIQPANPDLAGHMSAALAEGRNGFQRFFGEGYLVDSISYDGQPHRILTPNGYSAFALDFPLPDDLQRSMVLQAREELAGRRGVCSLAPRDWAATFPTAFLEDPRFVHDRRMASVGIFNYHRGIEWEWLNPFFVAAELRAGTVEDAYRLYVKGQVVGALHEGGIGGLSELYDLHGETGADFQAWSMAGFIESLHLFAGVRVDALRKTVQICPSLPADWPFIRCRRRVGNLRFDILYERPGPDSHHLELRLLDSVPADFQLHVQFRVAPRVRVRHARENGADMPIERWEYRSGQPSPADDRVTAVFTLDRDLDIQLEV